MTRLDRRDYRDGDERPHRAEQRSTHDDRAERHGGVDGDGARGDPGEQVVLDLLVDDAEHHDPQGVDRLRDNAMTAGTAMAR